MRTATRVIPPLFLASFAAGWFVPPSSVGIGDWDQFFSEAWVCSRGLLERGWPAAWSVQLAGGAPLAGDPQSLADSPFLLLPLWLGPVLGTKVLVLALLGVGLVGCHRLGMRWLADPVAAAAFAFAFTFSGYFAIHLRQGHLPWAAFYLVPWMILFVDRLLFEAEPDPAASVGLVTFSYLLFSGMVYHPLIYFALPAGIVYAVVEGRFARRSRIAHVLVLLICAIVLTAPRWVAVLDWQLNSPREVAGRGGMPLAGVIAMLVTPIEDYKVRLAPVGSGVWEYWSYLGVPVTALGIFGWIRGTRRERNLAVTLLVIGFILAWYNPFGSGLEWVAVHVPVLSSVRVYSRFVGLVVFAIALLAGGALAEIRSQHPRLWWLPLMIFLAIVADYTWVVRPFWCRVFSIPRAEIYPSWNEAPPAREYVTIRTAPPYQSDDEGGEILNSRMLPMLMAGSVVRNAYVALSLPWMHLQDGPVAEGPRRASVRVTNHAIEIEGDLHPGDEIFIHLLLPDRYWAIKRHGAARVLQTEEGAKVVVVRPCSRVRLLFHEPLEEVAWLIAAAGLALTAAVLRREKLRARAMRV